MADRCEKARLGETGGFRPVASGGGGAQLPDFVAQRFEFGLDLFAATPAQGNENGRRQQQYDELRRDQNNNMV